MNINGWANSTFIDNINLEQTIISVEEIEASRINIFPNPASETVNIELSNQIATDANIVLTNSVGQIISNLEYKGGPITLDVSTYAAGLYFVKLTADNVLETKMLIIE